MVKRKRLILVLGLCMPLCMQVAGQDNHPPATQPTTHPVDSAIRKQFDQLFDADPKVRDQAKTDLMGMDFGGLLTLRQLVKDKAPLPVGVLDAVHDVVIQVYLAHEKYTDLNQQSVDVSSRNGPFFLGIMWDGASEDNNRLGLTVERRLPGFPSYRFLRRGDLILDITLHPGLLPNPTHTIDDLKNTIRLAPGVQDIVLSVVRNGELISIPITMAPRPIESGPPDGEQQQMLPAQNHMQSVNEFIAARNQSAEDYWLANFVPDQNAAAGD